TPEALRHLRAVAAAAAARALGTPRGPVHLNAPFREPLMPLTPPGPRPDDPKKNYFFSGGPADVPPAVRIAPGKLEPDEAALDASAAWTLCLSEDGALFDPGHSASLAICGEPVRACVELARRVQRREPGPGAELLVAERRTRAALEAAFADEAQLSEPSVARA